MGETKNETMGVSLLFPGCNCSFGHSTGKAPKFIHLQETSRTIAGMHLIWNKQSTSPSLFQSLYLRLSWVRSSFVMSWRLTQSWIEHNMSLDQNLRRQRMCEGELIRSIATAWRHESVWILALSGTGGRGGQEWMALHRYRH